MRILICDDEQQYTDAILACVRRWCAARSFAAAVIDTFASSEDMLDALKSRKIYDLAFLDIEFPGEISGLQLAGELRHLNAQMNIVFISNYEQYAVDGYKVNALRYLFKPVNDAQIFECLDIARRQCELAKDSFLLVEDNQQLCRMSYQSILFIESVAHYVRIHFVDGEHETITARKRLAELLKVLPAEMFVQCHQSFIVNLLYVQSIGRRDVVLSDGKSIPLSPRKGVELLTRFKSFYQGASL